MIDMVTEHHIDQEEREMRLDTLIINLGECLHHIIVVQTDGLIKQF